MATEDSKELGKCSFLQRRASQLRKQLSRFEVSVTQVEVILLAFSARRNELPEEEELLALVSDSSLEMVAVDLNLFNRVKELNLLDGLLELRKTFGLPETPGEVHGNPPL